MLRQITSALVTFMVAVSLLGGAANVKAADGISPSDVVLAFDFSASMKEDGKNIDTAGALNTLAKRILSYTDDIIEGKIIVHLVWFRGSASPVPQCETLSLTSQNAVDAFADCLTRVAKLYKDGPAEWKNQVPGSNGTNYTAAFDKAITLLTDGTTDRPAIIFFTDGEHTGEESTAPAGREWLDDIIANTQQLLPQRAVLPVGLGVEGDALDDLLELRNLTNLTKCPANGSGIIEWDEVSFPTGTIAGNRVADAFAAVTCVEVNKEPPPPAVPEAPAAPAVSGGDSSATVQVEEPESNGSPISSYEYECISEVSGTAVAANSDLPAATIEGLQNGEDYRCRAAAVNGVGQGAWSEPSSPFTPCAGLFGCNPWLLPLLLLLLLLLLLAAAALALWAWRQRTRGYVVASVAGFPQVNLLRGPRTGMSFVSSASPTEVDGLRRDIQSSSHLAIENLGGGRFKWTDRAGGGSGVVEPGQSFTVTDPTGAQREVKLRAFGGRPKNVQTTVSLASAAGAATTASWGSGSSSDGWGGGGSGWDGGGTSSSGGGWG
jgi:uncharacterized membrane protein YgcG